MTFSVTHRRAFVGTDLSIKVVAVDKESIAAVSITLDSQTLEELELGGGTQEYTRNFSGAGGSEPGMDHLLVVTAMDQAGAPHGSTTHWDDN